MASFSRSRLLFIFIVLGFINFCCGKQEPSIPHPAADNIVMTFGNHALTTGDILIAFQESSSFDEIRAATDSEGISKNLQNLGMMLTFERDLAGKARTGGLDQSEDFKKQHQNIVNDELAQKIILKEILETTQVNEADLEGYYQENRDSLFVDPDTNKLVVQGIYVFADQHPEGEALAIAQKAYDAIKSGKPFEEIAKMYSDAPVHLRGKESSFPLSSFSPEIAAQLEKTPFGETTDVFLYKNRYFIFKKIRFINPEYLPYEKEKPLILISRIQELRDQRSLLLTQELEKKHGLLINSSWLDQSAPPEDQAIILSVPGIYELSLGEFKQYAREQNKLTAHAQKEYLALLGNKALCLAEARARGWSEKDVASAVRYWDDHYLAKRWIQSQMDKQVSLTEDQMREFYEKNSGNPLFQIPELYDLSRIFVSIPMTPSTSYQQTMILFGQAELLAQRIRQELMDGMPFDEAAAQFSEQENLSVIQENFGTVALGELSPMDLAAIAPSGVQTVTRETNHPSASASNPPSTVSSETSASIPAATEQPPSPETKTEKPSSTQSEKSKLQPGEISEPKRVYNISKGRYGFDLFYVRSVIPSRPMRYEEARVVIGQRVAQSMSQKIRTQAEQDFSDQNQLQVNQEAMQAVTAYLSALSQKPEAQADIARYEEP